MTGETSETLVEIRDALARISKHMADAPEAPTENPYL